jgi:hypothetical protein
MADIGWAEARLAGTVLAALGCCLDRAGAPAHPESTQKSVRVRRLWNAMKATRPALEIRRGPIVSKHLTERNSTSRPSRYRLGNARLPANSGPQTY